MNFFPQGCNLRQQKYYITRERQPDLNQANIKNELDSSLTMSATKYQLSEFIGSVLPVRTNTVVFNQLKCSCQKLFEKVH